MPDPDPRCPACGGPVEWTEGEPSLMVYRIDHDRDALLKVARVVGKFVVVIGCGCAICRSFDALPEHLRREMES